MNRDARTALKVSDVVRPTTFVESARLSERLGAAVTIASESFQHTGSFKFRAAYNLAASVEQDELITASSGNFGQALAYACRLLGKSCIVVMPDNSSRVKVAAVREYGAVVDLVGTKTKSRAERVAELAREHPDAFVASAYDDPLVIAGNATLGEEIALSPCRFDSVVVPVGGGGLSAGVVVGLKQQGVQTLVYGAEPVLANDAARSFRAGEIVADVVEAQTIADGARTLSLGVHNWAVLRDGLTEIIEVSEAQIEEAVRLLYSLANLKSEPTGALSLGAILSRPDIFAGKSVCCVVSGGNVDAEVYARIIATA